MAKTSKYTAVIHSAFGYKGDMQFSGGLESRHITTARAAERVEKNGGVLFDSYGEAEDFCDWAMYTATSVAGLTPKARKVGAFSKSKVDGLQIFQPKAGALDSFRADPMSPMVSS